MKNKAIKTTRSLVSVILAVMVVGIYFIPVYAHHILGIPHYSYDERYPQAPVIKYAVDAGPYIVELTGYPGRPQPGERAEMHAYFKSNNGSGRVYDAPLRVRVVEGTHTSEDETGTNIYGPEMLEAESSLYVFHPTYPDDGEYTVKLSFEAEGRPITISFPLTVGQPESNWGTLALFGGFFVGVIVVVRAIAIKRKRKLAKETVTATV